MLTDFIEKALAQIDDLAELKVTLVALRLLDGKQSDTASVTEREVLAHPAVQSLSMPELTMRFALQKALSRGTLIEAQVGGGVRYFANNEASRQIIEVIESTANTGRGAALLRPYHEVISKEIERLELVEVYELSDKDFATLGEWAARGYSVDEVKTAVRLALHEPRPQNTPPRRLRLIESVLTQQPPQTPSNYYAVVFGDKMPLEPVTIFEALTRRKPKGQEFAIIEAAIEVFGVRAVCDGLTQITQNRQLDLNTLIPLLAEQDDAALAFERSRANVNVTVRELTRLYESVIGPTTGHIANEIKSVYDSDVQDLMTWRAVFEFAARQNKRNWGYIRKLLLNPSPDVFMPQPANEAAKFAFDEYKRRVGRLDPSVANEMNTVAQVVADEIRWRAAFDAGANANALNWNYIKKVLTSEGRGDKVEPVNDAAQWAFKEYRARIGRLDRVVAEGINEVALKATEPSLWERAFDESAKAGALKWVYIQKTVENLAREAAGGRPTRKRLSQYGTKGRKRRQVDYTDAEREAAEERAHKQLTEKSQSGNAEGK